MKWHDALFEGTHWLSHRLMSRIRHGVHSPFVFGLQNGALKDAAMTAIPEIEARRQALLQDQSQFERHDLGAGSRKTDLAVTKVGDFAHRSLQSEHAARVLRGLADGIHANKVLELGTALGITTAYLAYQRPSRQVWTIEGDPAVAKLAQQQWGNLGIGNIHQMVTNFDDGLMDLLKANHEFDFVLIDGNHTYEATWRYWNILKDKMSSSGCIVFDDIYWSREMNKAWLDIHNDCAVSLSLDYFHWGVVFMFPRPQKEYYHLRMPTSKPRTRFY